MKILHLICYYYPHIGGMEQVARDVVEALRDNNEQMVFCFNHEKGDVEDKVDGIRVVRCNCQAKVASQSLSLSYGRRLEKIINEFNPDLIIFHYPNPFSAHYLLKYIPKGCKLISYWHLDIIKQKILGKFFEGQTKRICKRSDRIVATSPNYIEGSKWLSAFRDKCRVIPCSINSDGFNISDSVKAKALEIKEKNKGKTICFALGRHVPYKGMEYLIRASKLLDDNYKIYIGGVGPLTESLKKLAWDDKKVEFLGKVSQENVSVYFAACDIFCFPSITKNEAFGIALAEGMSYGKPAITFTIAGSGVNYVSLNGITGIEVENRNVEKYAEAITTLANDVELRERYGEAARERVRELFTKDIYNENIKELVDGI